MSDVAQTDGGSAFPLPEARDAYGCGIYEAQRGMSLRDWFAGQALVGLISGDDLSADYAARCSYQIADAMLAERAKAVAA